MIDGINIKVYDVDVRQWLEHPYLSFVNNRQTLVDDATVVHEKDNAEYKGLTFEVVPTNAKGVTHHMYIHGSLHKYKNNGQHNANDFTIEDLVHTIQELCTDFYINPKRAYIKGLEFGVNVLIPIKVNNFVRRCVATGNRELESYWKGNKKVGRVLHRNEYDIKVYDKGLLSGMDTTNLMRFEVALKGSKIVKRNGIDTLHDLMKLDKVERLGNVLVSRWKDFIYINPNEKWQRLTSKERLRMTEHANPNFWTSIKRDKRRDRKKLYHKYLLKSSVTDYHTKTGDLVATKWRSLTVVKTPRFTEYLDTKTADKNPTFYQLVYVGENVGFKKVETVPEMGVKIVAKNTTYNKIEQETQKRSNHSHKKTVSQKRVCVVCNASILHKRQNVDKQYFQP